MDQDAVWSSKRNLFSAVKPSKSTDADTGTGTDASPLRARSFSVASLDLLDDDPFANLTSIPRLSDSPTSFDHYTLCQVPQPSSVVVSPQVYLPKPTIARPKSSGNGQARPAHTRPAFAPRPSLPSLHKLAQMNVSVPGRKVPFPFLCLVDPIINDAYIDPKRHAWRTFATRALEHGFECRVQSSRKKRRIRHSGSFYTT